MAAHVGAWVRSVGPPSPCLARWPAKHQADQVALRLLGGCNRGTAWLAPPLAGQELPYAGLSCTFLMESS